MDPMSFLIGTVITLICVAVGLKLIAKLTCGRYTIHQDLSDKSILITGASRGIGLVAARRLAEKGAAVHMLCRNVPKAELLCRQLRRQTGNNAIFVWEVDVSRLVSVRSFAANFLKSDHNIDVLINNAGVAWLQARILTEDELELTMATNHFGHFLLTNLLLDRIMQSDAGRVVNVASTAHLFANLDLTDINMDKGYSSARAYNNSKLANILFTKHLARLMANTAITTNCLHPGAVATDLFRNVSWWMQLCVPLLRLWFKSAEEGAETLLHSAVAPQLCNVSGAYFVDCRQSSFVSRKANDSLLAQQLWNLSAQLTGLQDPSAILE